MPDPSGPLTVLHVVGSLDDATGGLQSAVVAIAGAHARAGHRVIIATVERPDDTHAGLGPLDARIETRLFPVSRLGGRLGRSASLDRWLRSHLADVDVVHVHSLWNAPVFSAGFRAVRHDRRLVISPHGSLDPFDLAKHTVAKRIVGRLAVRPLLARAGTILCTTAREVVVLELYGARACTTVAALPPGAPAPPARAVTTTREGLGLDPDARLLLFLGRIDYKKGLPPLLRALALMDPTTHLVIAGAGTPAYEAVVRDEVSRLGVEDRVHLTGWVSGEAKSDLLAAADAFVLLSDRENYGIAVIEAVQALTPVVITSEVFVSGPLEAAGAALVTTQDPRRAADDLTALLDDPGRLTRMRDAAARFVREELDRDRIDAALDATLRP